MTRGQEGGLASLFVNVMNHEDAEQQAEHDLTKKRRAKLFCFVCTIKKNHSRIPPQSTRLGGHLSFFVLPSPRV
jgi:hypothetical protein